METLNSNQLLPLSLEEAMLLGRQARSEAFRSAFASLGRWMIRSSRIRPNALRINGGCSATS